MVDPAETIFTRHAECHAGSPDEYAVLKKSIFERCTAICNIYGGGLALQLAQSRVLTVQQYHHESLAQNIEQFEIPMVQAIYGARAQGAIRAFRAAHKYHLQQARVLSAKSKTILQGETVKDMLQRVDALMQPVFICPHITKQQEQVKEHPCMKTLPAMRRTVGTSTSRAQLSRGRDGTTVTTTLHNIYNVKSMHRPCRTSAGVPFGVHGIRWNAARIDVPGHLRNAIGGKHVLSLIHQRSNDCTSVVIVGGYNAAMPSPERGAHCVIADGTVHLEPLLNVSDYPLPRAVCKDMDTYRNHAHKLSKMLVVDIVLPAAESECVTLLIAAPSDWVPPVAELQDDAVWLNPGRVTGQSTLQQTFTKAVTDATFTDGLGQTVDIENEDSPWSQAAVVVVRSAVALSIIAFLERTRGVAVDYGTMWGASLKEVCLHSVRLLRFGEPSQHALSKDAITGVKSWYGTGDDVVLANADSWTRRGVRTWTDVLHTHGVDGRDPEAMQRHSAVLTRSVLCLGEPLRWYTVRAARSMNPEVRMPPVQKAETPSTALTYQQQFDLIAAAVWSKQHSNANVRNEFKRMLRVYYEQIGRYPYVGAPRTLNPNGSSRSTGSKHKRTEVWCADQAGRKTRIQPGNNVKMLGM